MLLIGGQLNGDPVIPDVPLRSNSIKGRGCGGLGVSAELMVLSD